MTTTATIENLVEALRDLLDGTGGDPRAAAIEALADYDAETQEATP